MAGFFIVWGREARSEGGAGCGLAAVKRFASQRRLIFSLSQLIRGVCYRLTSRDMVDIAGGAPTVDVQTGGRDPEIGPARDQGMLIVSGSGCCALGPLLSKPRKPTGLCHR